MHSAEGICYTTLGIRDHSSGYKQVSFIGVREMIINQPIANSRVVDGQDRTKIVGVDRGTNGQNGNKDSNSDKAIGVDQHSIITIKFSRKRFTKQDQLKAY